MAIRLSKSKILAGLQCEKRLWLEIHRPDLIEYSKDAQQRFAAGHEVGEVACSLVKDGIMVELEGGIPAALSETKRILDEIPNKPIFEASFVHNNVLIRADILKNDQTAHNLIEVKSSTKVKDNYYQDCAVQSWVIEGNGLKLNKIELAHIDNTFIYQGDGNYNGLLHHENITNEVRTLTKEVPKWVKKFKKSLDGSEPEIETGTHCNDPYECPFIDYCSVEEETDYPVSCLPRGKITADELYSEGITDIRDIPEDRLDNETHEWIRKVTIKGEPNLLPDVKDIMNSYSYPRYYLDFETSKFVVPIWKDTRPYQTLQFQWSCHIENKPNEFKHEEFLDTTGSAPMRPFIESLLKSVKKRGPIFVYSAYEKTQLINLADRFPDLEDQITKVIDRLVDLLPISRRYYYHPDMHGSWSIKAVLPTIAPHLDYSDLDEIQHGGAAEAAYLEIIHPGTDKKRKELLIANLLEYCKRDTEALVYIAHYFATGKKPKKEHIQLS